MYQNADLEFKCKSCPFVGVSGFPCHVQNLDEKVNC